MGSKVGNFSEKKGKSRMGPRGGRRLGRKKKEKFQWDPRWETFQKKRKTQMGPRGGRALARCRWLLRLHFPGCYPQIDSLPLCYTLTL